MSKGTAPAWQVRDTQRQKLLEVIQQKIIRWENDYLWSSHLHNIFHHLLETELILGLGRISEDDISRIYWKDRIQVTNLFGEVLKEIRDFQRSSEEEKCLLAKLYVWTAGEVARPYHSALDATNLDLLKRVYGVKSAMDEVPFE